VAALQVVGEASKIESSKNLTCCAAISNKAILLGNYRAFQQANCDPEFQALHQGGYNYLL
jgi:hypothetical protein